MIAQAHESFNFYSVMVVNTQKDILDDPEFRNRNYSEDAQAILVSTPLLRAYQIQKELLELFL